MSLAELWALGSYAVTVFGLPCAAWMFWLEQRERMMTIFDMLIALFERAYLIAYREGMSATELRRWNSWDDYMREWCRRDDFRQALPLLLRGEDPDFVAYIRRIAEEESGEHLIIADIHS